MNSCVYSLHRDYRSVTFRPSFANELILLRDGYLQVSTDFQMTRSDINSILWHVVHA